MNLPERALVLRRDPAASGQVYWHLSDAAGATVWPFLDHILAMVDTQGLQPKTVEGRAYALLKWHRFLASRRLAWWQADDALLAAFRDALLAHQAANGSGNSQARRRTVNLDLRHVYAYCAWLQSDAVYGRDRRLLGASGHPIRSTLLIADQVAARAPRARYPLTYRHAGERSKHRVGFVPDETHRAALTAYFSEVYPPDIACRNCLIFELAWHVGWRRGSILSLTTPLFDAVGVDGEHAFTVTPPTQKFGYSNAFSVPQALTLRVRQFIEHERLRTVTRTKSVADQLFLSQRTGIPLTPGAVSGMFGRARRALGWPRGAALHAWRRGFTNAYIEREIDARLELGLDTGGEAIALSVAQALGHESVGSQAAYVRDAQRRLRGTATYRDKEEHARLADENARLGAEVAALRKQLAGR